LGTVYMVIAIIATCFAITSLTRMVSEERHNRQEQLYALPLSRLKVFVNYTIIAWVLGAFAIFAGVFGVYVSQMGIKGVFFQVQFLGVSLPWLVGWGCV